jgi:ATP-dependent Lhr-like helicase
MRQRVYGLLARYGVIFKQILTRELPSLQWSAVFRTLRLMELAGEVISGVFFKGIPSLQFIAPTSFRLLKGELPHDAVFWLNACDPASPCGLRLDGIDPSLPRRVPTNHLVFHGSRVALLSKRMGRDVEIRSGPEDPNLRRYLSMFGHWTRREVRPLKAVRVETINGVSVEHSPYAPVLEESGFLSDYKTLILRADYK